jgi:hypothetical protein
MRRLSLRILIALIACASLPAHAMSAYKCTAVDGKLSFQDQPCRPTSAQQRIHLADDVSSPATPAEEQDAPVAATPSPPRTSTPLRSTPPPSFFICIRYDDTRYASDSGVGAARWVPTDVMLSNRGLLTTLGGGTSASVHAAATRGAGSYVRADDECLRAAPREACAFLRAELDEVQDTLKRAFSDTEAQLRQNANSLRERMRGC